MNTMKAVSLRAFGGVDAFEEQLLPCPRPAANEVLVRIRAAAFNPIDYQMRQGATESKLLHSPVLGRELSGEVWETGRDVTRFAPGDAVAAYVGSLASNGTYAEYISIPEQLLAKKPPQLTHEQAAALPMAGMTALQIVKRLPVSMQEPLLITGGAGGVGTMLIKLLLAAGAARIITTAGNDASIRHLTSLGIAPENTFNYRDAALPAALRTASGTGSFRCIIDLVGGAMSEICAALLDVYGTYVDVTALSTAKARESLFDKAACVLNIANYAHALGTGPNRLKYYGDSLAELFSQIETGAISPAEVHVVGELSVAAVQEAHRMMEQNETGGRKLVMVV